MTPKLMCDINTLCHTITRTEYKQQIGRFEIGHDKMLCVDACNFVRGWDSGIHS